MFLLSSLAYSIFWNNEKHGVLCQTRKKKHQRIKKKNPSGLMWRERGGRLIFFFHILFALASKHRRRLFDFCLFFFFFLVSVAHCATFNDHTYNYVRSPGFVVFWCTTFSVCLLFCHESYETKMIMDWSLLDRTMTLLLLLENFQHFAFPFVYRN